MHVPWCARDYRVSMCPLHHCRRQVIAMPVLQSKEGCSKHQTVKSSVHAAYECSCLSSDADGPPEQSSGNLSSEPALLLRSGCLKPVTEAPEGPSLSNLLVKLSPILGVLGVLGVSVSPKNRLLRCTFLPVVLAIISARWCALTCKTSKVVAKE